MGHQVTVVAEERSQRYREHEGHKEREHYVVAPGAARRAEVTLCIHIDINICILYKSNMHSMGLK